jgi:hypothetical protein
MARMSYSYNHLNTSYDKELSRVDIHVNRNKLLQTGWIHLLPEINFPRFTKKKDLDLHPPSC